MTLIFFQVLFAETQIQTTVDKNRIRINEALTLKITAKESDDFPKLKLTDLKDFTVISGPGLSSSFQWVNGKMSSSKTLSWTLIPNKIGNLIIPSFPINIGGGSCPLAGDSNGDGTLNVLDVVLLVNLVLEVSDPDECSDINGDGALNVLDVVLLVNLVLGGMN